MSDLFAEAGRREAERSAPLAARMRPRTLDEFVGQQHIVGPGRLLRRAIQADQLSSLIFYGPPGTGKTTLARIIANTTKAHFIAINAVLAGVKELRAALQEAAERRDVHGQRTILFVDEVHRWNKAQQDALLPWVENGNLVLIGATTENPYFEVIKPLVSRSRIFQLQALSRDDLAGVIAAALDDPNRGFGGRMVAIDAPARDHLIDISNGDARSLLNALELAVETTSADDTGRIQVTLEVAEESIQRRAVLYDREGDVHYDTISAFIKSLRGSDPDAALYWMARMVYAGEDPRFIFRRMLILAAEDVGLADPQAIVVVAACAQAFDYVGLPEGQFHLAQAALYLATTAKSNTTLGFFDALKAVQEQAEGEGVPSHLRDGNRDAEGFGHGEGYKYPHAYQDHWVAQRYLPGHLQDRVFYQPSAQGFEGGLVEVIARRREAQVAAMLEGSPEPREGLTHAGARVQQERERWLVRTSSGTADHVAQVRDRVLAVASPARHHVALDLRLGSGLVSWELLRRVPEGGVWSLAWPDDPEPASQFAGLPESERPRLMVGRPDGLPALLDETATEVPAFDVVVGRNSLGELADATEVAAVVRQLLAGGGCMCLAESLPRLGSRPSELLGETPLAARVREAEEEVYAHHERPRYTWDAGGLASLLPDGDVEEVRQELTLRITAEAVARWFSDEEGSWGARLGERLGADLLQEARVTAERSVGRTVTWRVVTGVLAVGHA